MHRGPLALPDKAGFRADVARWMLAMDVVALTLVGQESFGMVLAEALTLGRKVVASATGGTAEAIADGVTGRLVPPGNPSALAAMLEAPGTGAQATAAMRARFAPEVFCGRIAAVYDAVLDAG